MENNSINCLLCLSNHVSQLINIFDKKSVTKHIVSIITKHLWFLFEINNKDVNTYICKVCWSKISSFHSFYMEVYNKHKKLHSKLYKFIKVEVEDEHEHNLNTCDDDNGKLFESIEVVASYLEPKIEIDIKEKKIDDADEKKINEPSHDDNYNVDPSELINDNISVNNTSDDKCSEKISNSKKFKAIKDKLTFSKRKGLSSKNVELINQDKINEQNKQIQEFFTLDCELCSIRLDTLRDIRLHYRKEHNVAGYIRCCNHKFMKKMPLMEHIEWHLNPNAFQCEICNKSYAHKRSLLDHHKATHLSSEERPFKCSECPKTFIKNSSLENHLTTHNNEKKFTCGECGKSYGTKKVLRTHTQTVHEGLNVHICDICAKEFRSKVGFEEHQKTVHQNIVLPKVQCQVCGIWLKREYYLRQHMVLHEESKVGFFCNICGRKSLNRKALHKHVATVHSDKVYNCTMCEKIFKKQISLKEHMATHAGVTLYSCPHCSRTFNSSSNMSSHKKKIHVKEWEEHKRLKATGVI